MLPARASRLNRFSPSCAVIPELSTIDLDDVAQVSGRHGLGRRAQGWPLSMGRGYTRGRVLLLYPGQVVASCAQNELYRQPPPRDVSCFPYESEVPVHA